MYVCLGVAGGVAVVALHSYTVKTRAANTAGAEPLLLLSVVLCDYFLAYIINNDQCILIINAFLMRRIPL